MQDKNKELNRYMLFPNAHPEVPQWFPKFEQGYE